MWRYGLVVVGVLIACCVEAAPGGSAPRVPRTGQNQAAEKHYKEGLRHRDAAWVYEEKMAGTKTEKDRAAYAKFIQHTYLRALAEFEKAVENDDQFYQAYSSLGYVRRKTGNLVDALTAYDKALALSPTYAEAIEYRAEAYLELDRVEDAQKAFGILASLNKPYAARLLDFTEKWAQAHADQEVGHTMLTWVEEKREALGEVKDWVEKW
jgi:tetratricopeptide (TPR) repeat protein